MATIGYATMAVIPSLRGVTAEMNKQISGPMTEAGKKAGNQLGQGIASGVEQAKTKVEKASSDVAKARAAEKDAADKVHVAEQKLLALRNRGVTDVGRLADAEAKVNKAKRDSEIRSNATATADRNLARARQDVTTASRTGAQSVQQFGDAANRSSGGLSAIKTAGPLAAAGIAAVAAAAISAGKFIGEIGTTFNEMRSKMQLATGAGTETLNKLNESVKNVAKGSPAAIGTIAERMTILYQRTGLTGETLETLTKQVNKAGAALGQDLDLKQLTGTMATFGVKGTEISGVLDDIFRVSRNTGMGMNEIISAAKTAAPSLQEFGFSLSDSAALIGSLDKAGVDASSVLATFGRGLVNVAKAGQSPKQAFADVTTQIQGFIQQGNIAGAVNVAGKIFGTRGAVQFVNAVKSGAVSMDQLTNSAAKQGDSILDAEGATVTWAKTWGLFKNNVIIALEPLATRFFNVFIEGMTWLRTNGVVAIQFLSSVFTPVFDAISPLAERIFPLLGTAITTVAGVISEFAQKALAAAEFVNRNRAVFIAVAGVITALFLPALVSMGITMAANAATMGVMAVGMTAYNIATKAIAIATRVWAAAQWALNAAFVGNPLGIAIAAIVAIGAAIFLAYKKSETFRNIVQSVWQWVQRAGSAIMGGLVAAFKWVKDAISPVIGFVKRFWQILVFGLGPIGIIVGVVTQLIKHWDLVKAAFSAVGSAAMWLWNNIITPVFNGIKAAIGIWWTGVQIYFQAWKTAITWVGQAATWLWQNAIQPAWNGIVAAGQFLWSGVSTIFEWFKAGIKVVGDIVNWLWQNAVQPAFSGIGAVIGAVWSGVVQPAFDGFKTAIKVVGDIVNWLWKNVMVPAWDAIKTAISTVWNFIKPILDNIGKGIQAVGDIATKVGDAMRNAFNGVVDVLKTPIHAVGKLLAAIPDNILGVSIPGAGTIKSWGETMQSLRSGGPVEGAGGPRDDKVLLWGSNGEFMMQAQAVQKYGLGFMNAVNSGALPAFANGGPIGEPYGLPTGSNISYGAASFPDWVTKLGAEHNVKPSTYAGHQESDRGEAGYAANPQHLNRGIDWSGPVEAMDAFARYLLGIAPSTPALEQIIWQNPNTGAKVGWHGRSPDAGFGYFAADYGGHTDHVHTRQSAAFGGAAKPTIPDTNTKVPGYVPPTLNNTPDTTTTTPSTPSTPSTTKTRMKSFKELGQEAGGLVAEGIADFFDLPSWITDPASAVEGDDGSNVRTTSTTQGQNAGNSTINTPDTTTTPSTPSTPAPTTPTPPAAPTPGTLEAMPKITYSPSGGAEQWRPMMKWAIEYVRQGLTAATAQINAGVAQIKSESGGNPKILQQVQDVNSGGNEAQGLLQIIPGTFAANRDPRLPNDRTDPAANIVAALRYYVPKYGPDLTKMWGHGHGYRLGGWTGNGPANSIAGVVHGREFVVNALNARPNLPILEAINRGEDPAALVAADAGWSSVVDQSPREHATTGASGGRTTNITVYGHTAGDIAQEIDRHQWRGSGGYGSRMR